VERSREHRGKLPVVAHPFATTVTGSVEDVSDSFDREHGTQQGSGDTAQEPAASSAAASAGKAQILAALARRIAAGNRQQSLPERLADACQHILGVDGAAITLENTSIDHITLWTTTDAAARLDDLEEVTGEGPGLHAFRTGTAVSIRIVSGGTRWPHFVAAARDLVGEATIHALPIRSDNDVIGVLGLYQMGTEAAAPRLDQAQFLADAIGAALLLDTPDPDQQPGTGPWFSRAEIHQATGMVIAQLHCAVPDALAILRAHAYAHESTLHDIAAQVITGRLDFGSDSP
jgi:ANTAR domain/GAF domain